MASRQKIYFIICKDCGYHKSAAYVLKKTDFKTLDELQNNIKRLSCSDCGSKHIQVQEKPRPSTKKITYVATLGSADQVFHKSTCGWMQSVAYESEIRFADRQAAINRNYRPCTSCRP